MCGLCKTRLQVIHDLQARIADLEGAAEPWAFPTEWDLTECQRRILTRLKRAGGRVPRSSLATSAGVGGAEVSLHALRQHIKNIRRKLQAHGLAPVWTERGIVCLPNEVAERMRAV